jgi:hypothetical protein
MADRGEQTVYNDNSGAGNFVSPWAKNFLTSCASNVVVLPRAPKKIGGELCPKCGKEKNHELVDCPFLFVRENPKSEGLFIFEPPVRHFTLMIIFSFTHFLFTRLHLDWAIFWAKEKERIAKINATVLIADFSPNELL